MDDKERYDAFRRAFGRALEAWTHPANLQSGGLQGGGQFGPKFARSSDLPPLIPTTARWNGRLPLGEVTLLVGSGGVGKGLLGVWLASHIASGRPLPDEDNPYPKGDVCVVTLEDSLAIWMARYNAAGGDPSGLVMFRIDNEAFTIAALDTLSGRYGLLIIDPAISLCGAEQVHPSNPAKVRAMIDKLQRVAQRLQCPVLLIHHPNGRGTVLGGPAWTAAVRSQLEFGRQKDGTLGLFHTKFNNVMQQEPAQFHIDTDEAHAWLHYVGINEDLKPYVPRRPKAGDDDGSGKTGERINWVLDTLAEHRGDMANADLRAKWTEDTGLKGRTLNTVLEIAERQGKIVRIDQRPTRGFRVMLRAVHEQDQLVDERMVDQLMAGVDEELRNLTDDDKE